MKIFKILLAINFFISTVYSQEIKTIIPLTKTIHSIKIVENGDTPFFIYKKQGILSVMDSEESFPGKTITDIDSLTIINEYFVAQKAELWGIYDITTNEFTIPPVYDKIVPISDTELFYANKYGATTIIDFKNNKIMPFKPDNIFRIGKKIGKMENNVFIYDYKDKRKYFIATIPENYEFDGNKKPVDLYVLNKDVFVLKFKDPKYWELHKTGKDKVQFESKGRPYKAYKDGIVFMLMRRHRLQSLIGYNGETILPFKYSSIKSEKDKKGNYFVTTKSRKKGLFNIEKGFLIDTVCSKISTVSKENDIYLITKLDKKSYLYSLKDNSIIYFSKTAKQLGNYLLVGEHKKLNLISMDGQVIFKNNWEKVNHLISDLFVVVKGGKQALLNNNGEFVTLFENVKYKSYKKFFIQKQKKDGKKNIMIEI